ncbi:MAG: S41 family peptidase [Planctomycetota bacterium]|jgi:carboxyl-terminal processing protease
MKNVVAPMLLVVLGGALLIQLPLAIADRTSTYEWFDPIIDIRTHIVRDFVEQPDEDAMQQAMIDSMIDTLDDPYTVFVPPADEDAFNKELRGTYVGIGAEVNIIDDYLTIVSPMDDSPALEAGVLAGDVVLEIEGESTYQLSVDDCIERLVGEPNTPVEIHVRHLDGTEEDISILRRRIVTRSIKGLRRVGEEWNHCIDGDAGLSYIRVTQFLADTVDDLRSAIEAARDRGELNGLVLDLRDNPGGALDAAVLMSDLFLEDGVIVSIKGRNHTNERAARARPDGTLPEFPMVVLVNGNSASASEIVAGALQDNGRAKVVGTRTYGKGSVQEVRELPYRRGTLKITTAYYYLPNGRNLNRGEDSTVWGVDPDPGLVVPETIDEYLDRLRARREFEVIRDPVEADEACGEPEWIRENLKDEPLAAAIEALQSHVAGDDWPTLSDLDPAVAAVDEELEGIAAHRGRLLQELRRVEDRIRELSAIAAESGQDPLLPPDIELVDGTLELRDRDGNVIGTYRIDSEDIRISLNTARLSPLAPEEVVR